ncbi:MAG: N-formylglutamate deformylase [Phyllobacteriaceae bacterium]|nr:N-formylglutamate deformylase [Phyllobacteriaceae bacterium]
MTPVEIERGDGPVILAFPHVGTFVPGEVKASLNQTGRALADTDWHVDRLYAGLLAGATIVRATFHRYVVDANRDPSGVSLYPGQNTTGLVPLTDFEGRPIWGEEPDETEIERRRLAFHAPYHAALAAEIDRVKARHGVAVLYDCHSIRSRLPFLFHGALPDFNIGTHDGRSCAPEIQALATDACALAYGYTSVVNGRFKGGWTTRHYGQPPDGVHAIQMELTQRTHLATEASPFAYDEGKAAVLRLHLGALLAGIERWALEAGR